MVIGQALVIRKENFTYVVKEGDSLYSIAKKVHLDMDDIMEDNNITDITSYLTNYLKNKVNTWLMTFDLR